MTTSSPVTARIRVRPAVAIGALAGRLLALAPGDLPRSALLATAAAVAFTVIGMGLGAVAGFVLDRVRTHRPAPVSGARLGVGIMIVAVALGVATRHEIAVRAAVGAPPIGAGWVLTALLVPLVIATAVVTVRPKVWAATVLVGVLAVTAGQYPAPAAATGPDVPDSPTLVYSTLREPGSFADRADRLAERWAASGGPAQRAVVITVPTGSGWVDAATVEGLDRYFDGAVRVIAMQYDDVASWKAFVSSPDAAGESAVAVLAAISRSLADVPATSRPRIYLTGQSLGAVGADAARAWAGRHRVELAGTILAGPPAGTVEATARCERRVVLANHDDPVTRFGIARLRGPVPLVSFVGTLLDLPGALAVPIGHGHRYGLEQGSAIAELPTGCQATGPRAAS